MMACAHVEVNLQRSPVDFSPQRCQNSSSHSSLGSFTCLAFSALILASSTLAVQVGMLLEEMERLGTKGEDGKVSIPPMTTLELTSLDADALLPLLELCIHMAILFSHLS
jgi:hypothetical protein